MREVEFAAVRCVIASAAALIVACSAPVPNATPAAAEQPAPITTPTPAVPSDTSPIAPPRATVAASSLPSPSAPLLPPGPITAGVSAPITEVEIHGCDTQSNKYELFTTQTDLHTYRDTSRGFEFSYPKQWGSLAVRADKTPVCVGPFVFGLGRAGAFGGGDDPLVGTSHGYFKKGDRYYRNWFKDDPNGPYPADGGDVFQLVPTGNGEALLNVYSECRPSGYSCFRVAMINLKGTEHVGIGIRSDRGTYDPQRPTYTVDDVVSELRSFLRTVKIY